MRGIRAYLTDAAGNRGPVNRGAIGSDSDVGQQEVQAILIEVHEAGKVNAHVDGTQVEANLLTELHSRIKELISRVCGFR